MRAFKWLTQRPGIVVVLAALCGVVCCAACLGLVWVRDEMKLYPRTILDDGVATDPGVLCTSDDDAFVQTAGQLLHAYSGDSLGGLSQVRARLPCGSPTAPSSLHAGFARIEWTTGLPHRIVASVGLDCSTGTASILIEDEGPNLREGMAMDLSEATIGLREAASIADSHGGEAVREQLGAACEMVAFLSDYEWRIWYYSEKTTYGLPLLTVRVDALSGRVTVGD